MQAEEGLGLEHQRERIRAYALENGYQLEHFFQDIASGNDKRSMMDRPEFSEAVYEAKRLHGTIIVARLDRISRNERKFLEFCSQEKIRIVSTVPGETEGFQQMINAVSKAERVRINIVQGTKKSLRKKSAQGAALGSVTTVLKANRASAKSRATASQMTVLDIRDFLLRHAELRDRTTAEIAAALNVYGLRSGHGRLWNKNSLRRQLRSARQELDLLDEPDDDF
ncbi:MAG: recombinase family protein [Rhodobacteraceae bacterium]|nr:recombinase family protein [Paracoccaceae bacterium]